jgi:hypothetical protein
VHAIEETRCQAGTIRKKTLSQLDAISQGEGLGIAWKELIM